MRGVIATWPMSQGATVFAVAVAGSMLRLAGRLACSASLRSPPESSLFCAAACAGTICSPPLSVNTKPINIRVSVVEPDCCGPATLTVSARPPGPQVVAGASSSGRHPREADK